MLPPISNSSFPPSHPPPPSIHSKTHLDTGEVREDLAEALGVVLLGELDLAHVESPVKRSEGGREGWGWDE